MVVVIYHLIHLEQIMILNLNNYLVFQIYQHQNMILLLKFVEFIYIDDSLLLINIPLFILKLLFNIHVCDASDIHNKHKDNNIFESILILLLFELIIVLLF